MVELFLHGHVRKGSWFHRFQELESKAFFGNHRTSTKRSSTPWLLKNHDGWTAFAEKTGHLRCMSRFVCNSLTIVFFRLRGVAGHILLYKGHRDWCNAWDQMTRQPAKHLGSNILSILLQAIQWAYWCAHPCRCTRWSKANIAQNCSLRACRSCAESPSIKFQDRLIHSVLASSKWTSH